jgi:octopine/nopaline transport system permease protein
MDLELIQRSLPLLLKGLTLTAFLSGVSIAIGFNLGLGLALLRTSSNALLAGFAKLYSLVFRGTPLLVQLFLFYYGLGQLSFVRHSEILWWIIGDGTRCAIMALALNTAAYTSEILRGGLLSVPAGAIEAAKACGMSRFLRFRRISFPLAIRQALPAYGNEIVLAVKGSSLASTITVLEITGHAKRLMSQTFAILEVFAIAGAIYLAINILLLAGTRVLEGRLMRHQAT